MKLTNNTCNKSDGKLGGEDSQEPRCSIERRSNFVDFEMIVEVLVKVVQQSRQLIHLDLQNTTHFISTLRNRTSLLTNGNIYISSS